MSEETRRIRATISGRVQNVGFRMFTSREARRLGLSGWVRNFEDGHAVLLEAEGPVTAVVSFEQAIHRGPPGARVVSVTVANISPEHGAEEGFAVR